MRHLGILLVAAGLAACGAPTAPATVEITPDAGLAVPGGHLKLRVTAKDAGGVALTGRVVTWTSSATAVATVSNPDSQQLGDVVGVALGTADITASVEGTTATAKVTVVPLVASVVVSPSDAAIIVGHTRQLTASPQDPFGNILDGYAPVWATTDATIATVSPTGLVTAIAPGAAQISASVAGRDAASRITTYPTVTGVWTGTGTTGGSTLIIQLTSTTEDASGALTAVGTVQITGVSAVGPFAFNAAGIRTDLDIALTMTVTGFTPFIFTGVYAGTTMKGSVNNSGFKVFPTTFTRTVVAGPAPPVAVSSARKTATSANGLRAIKLHER